MAHDCPDCGRLCYCDVEDTFIEEAPSDCAHWRECDRDMINDAGENFYRGRELTTQFETTNSKTKPKEI